MGKTLKRQRQRQLREAEQQPAAKKPAINPKKYSFLVSAALQERQWDQALSLLTAMRDARQAPKLGSVQRWVRDADMSGNEALAARLLDAILRTTIDMQAPAAAPPAPAAAAAAAEDGATKPPVRRHLPWVPAETSRAAAASAAESAADGAAAAAAVSAAGTSGADGPADGSVGHAAARMGATSTAAPSTQGVASSSVPLPDSYAGRAWVVPHAEQQRRPASRHDVLHAYPPDTISFDVSHPAAQRLDVPHVPGAFVLKGVLSRHECMQLVAASQALGYSAEVDYTTTAWRPDGASGNNSGNGGGSGGDAGASAASAAVNMSKSAKAAAALSAARAHAAGLAGLEAGRPASGCAWLADDGLVGTLFERCRHLLPKELGGGALAGLNARWRFYRYEPGAVYRPHVDGAWPGSGLTPDGKAAVFDAYGDRWSRLTFLLYLNEDFEGGCTTFYMPSPETVGCLDAHSVAPRTGNVLCFPHGDTAGSLVHEGSAVQSGAKYVMRSDVLYMMPSRRLEKSEAKPWERQ